MFDLSLYSIVLLVHIASGIVLVGSALFAPLTRHAILRAPTVDRLSDWLDFLRRSARANPPAAVDGRSPKASCAATTWRCST